MEWQPIKTAPKDGRPVLLWGGLIHNEFDDPYLSETPVKAFWYMPEICKEIGRHPAGSDWAQFVEDTCLQDSQWRVSDEPGYVTFILRPTHWMPLPAPPTTKPE